MHVDVPNETLAVGDDDRPLGPTDLRVEHAVGLRDLAMRPEVRAERVVDPAERIRPGLQRVHRVAADAHDLGFPTGEALLKRVQRGSFAVSGVRESEGEEREDDALSVERGERDLAAVVRAEREVRSGVTDLEGLRLGRDLVPAFRRSHIPRLAAWPSIRGAASPSITGTSSTTRHR